MALYKVIDKPAAYGLGYHIGAIMEIGEDEKITCAPYVPVTVKDPKSQEPYSTGKMIQHTKEYDAAYLMESGVILPADPKKDKEAIDKFNAEKAKDIASRKGSKVKEEK
jgi:hypothetical protein